MLRHPYIATNNGDRATIQEVLEHPCWAVLGLEDDNPRGAKRLRGSGAQGHGSKFFSDSVKLIALELYVLCGSCLYSSRTVQVERSRNDSTYTYRLDARVPAATTRK
jgi:hypothetical protein